MVSDVDSLSDGEIDRKAQKRSDRYADYRKRVASKAADIGTLHAVADPERKERCRTDLEAFLQSISPTRLACLSSPRPIVALSNASSVAFSLAVDSPMRCSVASASRRLPRMRRCGRFCTVIEVRLHLRRRRAGRPRSILGRSKPNSDERRTVRRLPRSLYRRSAPGWPPQRATSQHYKGERTHLHWTGDKLVLPTVAGSRSASGAVVSCKGITAVRRGMTHRRVDGTRQRRTSSFSTTFRRMVSPPAWADREPAEDHSKNVLKLAGHNRQIAIVCNGTVIEPDDLMDQLCDPTKSVVGVRRSPLCFGCRHT